MSDIIHIFTDPSAQLHYMKDVRDTLFDAYINTSCGTDDRAFALLSRLEAVEVAIAMFDPVRHSVLVAENR